MEGGGSDPAPARTQPDDDLGPKEAAEFVLPRGASVGRYVILDRLGAGGMGVVYAAYDPELDRKLALKLLASVVEDDRAVTRRHRLVREAQAMARLSHPNVITVHDVGTIDGARSGLAPGPVVFVAMEFIAGRTLSEWMKEPQPWTVVLEVFIRAAEGLAAAHAAGLVHRDFKPDNAMVADDGRVVVMDFGLARAATSSSRDRSGGDPDDSTTSARTSAAARPQLSTTVTAAGAIMGTPAYMAPEQHEGRAADDRSDQFAFCVALYEALYGERPFRGDEITVLAINVCAGNVRDAPAGSSVPPWLRAALLRGLSTDPGHRYPSMIALVADLTRDRSRRPKRWLLGGAVAAATAVGVWAGVRLEPRKKPCRGADAHVAEVWNDARREAVRRGLSETGLTFAVESWGAIAATVDEYTAAWIDGYTEACEATRVRGEQSEALLDLRMSCLGDRLSQLDAQLALLSRGDPQAAANALASLEGLGPIAACADASRLMARTPPPSDPDTAGRVEALRPHLARVAAMRRGGIQGAGLTAARSLVAAAIEVGYPPLTAEALVHLGTFELRADDWDAAQRHFQQALAEALRGGADALAGQAAVELVHVIGRDRAGYAEADAWAELASALLERDGGEPDVEVELLRLRARMLSARTRWDEAAPIVERARGVVARTHGRRDVRWIDTSGQLGETLLALGEFAEAEKVYTDALTTAERSLGPEHPTSAALHDGLGRAALGKGDLDAALDHHTRALAIRTEVFGESADELVESLRGLGATAAARGDEQEARAKLSRALGLSLTHRGDADATTQQIRRLRGDVERHAGRSQAAVDDYRAILAAAADDASAAVDLVDVRLSLGDALYQLSQLDPAIAAYRAALEQIGDDQGPDPRAWRARWGLGRCLRQSGDPATARTVLERALRDLGKDGEPTDLAAVQFDLVRALDDVGEHARARRASDELLQLLAQIDAPDLAADVAQWRSRRPPR